VKGCVQSWLFHHIIFSDALVSFRRQAWLNYPTGTFWSTITRKVVTHRKSMV